MIKPFRFFSMSTLSDINYTIYSHNLLCPYLLLCPAPLFFYLSLPATNHPPKINSITTFYKNAFQTFVVSTFVDLEELHFIYLKNFNLFIVFTSKSYPPPMNVKFL